MGTEEVHAKVSGEERERHEQHSNDRQRFHNFIHTVVDNRQVCILRAAHQVAQAFIEVMKADEMVINIAEKDSVLWVNDLVWIARKLVKHFALGEQDPPHGQKNAF